MDPRVVALHKAAAERPGTIGLAGALPAVELMPRAAIARALAEVATTREALQYGWPEGSAALRAWIAARLAARGAAVEPERVIVTAGAQQALAIAAELLHDYTIGVGEATYAAALDAFRRAGARVAVGGDARYVIAGVSNPHGVALAEPPLDRATIVDEAYVELRFDGRVPAPLVAAAPDLVWHVGTVSKTLAPGLRVGWLVPPRARLAEALAIKQASDLQTASVSQAALVRVLVAIDVDAVIARARREYARRAGALVEAIRRHVPGVAFREPEGGLSLWLELADAGDELALVRAALAEGVMFDPGSLFRAQPSERVALRLSFAGEPPERLVEGARRVARALATWRATGSRRAS